MRQGHEVATTDVCAASTGVDMTMVSLGNPGQGTAPWARPVLGMPVSQRQQRDRTHALGVLVLVAQQLPHLLETYPSLMFRFEQVTREERLLFACEALWSCVDRASWEDLRTADRQGWGPAALTVAVRYLEALEGSIAAENALAVHDQGRRAASDASSPTWQAAEDDAVRRVRFFNLRCRMLRSLHGWDLLTSQLCALLDEIVDEERLVEEFERYVLSDETLAHPEEDPYPYAL